MPMKIIFLDIDGVLNSRQWMLECDGEFDQPINQIDPKAVVRLNRITDATGAKIVVSSTWRLGFLMKCADPVLSLKGCLRTYGITGEVIDMTPSKPNCIRNQRGKEIQAWLDDNYSRVDKFIIIDDDSDMGKLKSKHFKTLFEDGLTDAIADKIIKVLGPKPVPARYTGESVREAIAPNYEAYYSKLSIGQPPNWKCDQRTKDNFCISQWMIEELTKLGCNQDIKSNTIRMFNRRARHEDDLWQSAANAMNAYLDGEVIDFQGLRRH